MVLCSDTGRRECHFIAPITENMFSANQLTTRTKLSVKFTASEIVSLEIKSILLAIGEDKSCSDADTSRCEIFLFRSIFFGGL